VARCVVVDDRRSSDAPDDAAEAGRGYPDLGLSANACRRCRPLRRCRLHAPPRNPMTHAGRLCSAAGGLTVALTRQASPSRHEPTDEPTRRGLTGRRRLTAARQGPGRRAGLRGIETGIRRLMSSRAASRGERSTTPSRQDNREVDRPVSGLSGSIPGRDPDGVGVVGGFWTTNRYPVGTLSAARPTSQRRKTARRRERNE